MGKENIFKKIDLPSLEVPTEVKKKVISDIESAKVLKELSSLFTSQYSSVVHQLFKKNITK
jgi:hypothetical protein